MKTSSISTRTLATVVAGGVGFFVVVAGLLPLVEPGYDLNRQAISELALGPGGWLLNVAFCVMGGATALLGLVLRRMTGARVAPVLLTIAGALDVVSGFVHAVRYDAAVTTAAIIHMIAGIATFILIIGAIFAMVRPFRRSQAWNHFARPTLAWAWVSAAAFILLGPGLLGQTHFGLQQRGMAVTFLSWMITTALTARQIAQSASVSDVRQVSRAVDPAHGGVAPSVEA
jgi:uncharacterized protein DUF998